MLEATNSPKSAQDQHWRGPGKSRPRRRAGIARIAVTVFPLLVVIAGVAGYLLPDAFKPLGPGVP